MKWADVQNCLFPDLDVQRLFGMTYFEYSAKTVTQMNLKQ